MLKKPVFFKLQYRSLFHINTDFTRKPKNGVLRKRKTETAIAKRFNFQVKPNNDSIY